MSKYLFLCRSLWNGLLFNWITQILCCYFVNRRHDAKSERDRFFCMHCPDYVAFYEWKELVEHNKTLHFRPGVMLQCPYCPKTLKESQKLIFDRHVAKHEGAEERKEKHKLYIKRYHKGLPKVTCLSCGEEFDNKLYLAQHQKLYGNFHDGKNLGRINEALKINIFVNYCRKMSRLSQF